MEVNSLFSFENGCKVSFGTSKFIELLLSDYEQSTNINDVPQVLCMISTSVPS